MNPYLDVYGACDNTLRFHKFTEKWWSLRWKSLDFSMCFIHKFLHNYFVFENQPQTITVSCWTDTFVFSKKYNNNKNSCDQVVRSGIDFPSISSGAEEAFG